MAVMTACIVINLVLANEGCLTYPACEKDLNGFFLAGRDVFFNAFGLEKVYSYSLTYRL